MSKVINQSPQLHPQNIGLNFLIEFDIFGRKEINHVMQDIKYLFPKEMLNCTFVDTMDVNHAHCYPLWDMFDKVTFQG